MADRIGVISKGALILVDEKAALMKKLGKKQLTLNLAVPLEPSLRSLPLGAWSLNPPAPSSNIPSAQPRVPASTNCCAE